jgi:uncharacterized protein (TIGR00251 family)
VSAAPWWRRSADGAATLAVHVQPGAKRTEIAGLHGAALKIRLAAPPVDGKANAALIDFLAERLHLPRGRVTLVTGATSRQKVLRVEGADEAMLAALEPPPED